MHKVPNSVVTIVQIEEASTFQSLAVSLRTTRFNVQKFYMVFDLR